MTTAYRWSKSIDSAGAGNTGFRYYIDPQRNRDGTIATPHVFVQSYIYELPFGKGKALANSGPLAWIVGGWQVNGILTMQTGAPFNLSVPGALNNAPGNSNDPNLVGEYRTPGAIGAHKFWFERNAFSGPGLFNLDASLFRKVRIAEHWRGAERGEF